MWLVWPTVTGINCLIHQISDEFVGFPQYALELADTFPNTIFVDNVRELRDQMWKFQSMLRLKLPSKQVLHTYEEKDELLELINEHIKCNVVKVRKAGRHTLSHYVTSVINLNSLKDWWCLLQADNRYTPRFMSLYNTLQVPARSEIWEAKIENSSLISRF